MSGDEIRIAATATLLSVAGSHADKERGAPRDSGRKGAHPHQPTEAEAEENIEFEHDLLGVTLDLTV